jgi:hypothetical protein
MAAERMVSPESKPSLERASRSPATRLRIEAADPVTGSGIDAALRERGGGPHPQPKMVCHEKQQVGWADAALIVHIRSVDTREVLEP